MRTKISRSDQHGAQQPFLRLSEVAYAVALAIGSVALAATPSATTAQTAAEQVQDMRLSYNIPAGPLAPALSSLARMANVLLTFTSEQTRGQTTAGVRGEYTVQEALTAVLAETDLQAVRMDNGGYVLRAAPVPVVMPTSKPASDHQPALPAVEVTAQRVRDGTTEDTRSFTTRTMSSATHLPLTMRETPQSVTVLTSARIAADNLVDLADIAKATPGLVLDSSQIRPVLKSRGYDIESVTQDGIATQYDWFNGDSLGNLAMQDRVEVVRGATGLMQGAGNPSAAVNMIRKRPTSSWQFKGSASIGSWNDYRLMTDVSGPLTNDGRVRGRVVGYIVSVRRRPH